MRNLLDKNGYIEAVIRRALGDGNEKLAEEIIARLRGDEEETKYRGNSK